MSKVNTEIAYKFIRNKILSGRYPPGAPLKSKRLTTDVGLSRTPIRDALRQLEADGLVEIRPRLGARVKELEIDELTELNEMRLALETYAAGAAATHRIEAELAEIRGILAEMEGLATKIAKDLENFDLILDLQQADLRFHLAVLSAAKNQTIRRECNRIHLLGQVLSAKYSSESFASYQGASRRDQVERIVAEHQQILRAIARGDVAAARKAMEAHLLQKVERCREASRNQRRQQEATANHAMLMDL